MKPKNSNRFRHEEIRGGKIARGVGYGKHGTLNSLGGLTPSGIERVARLLSQGKRLSTGLSGSDIEQFLMRMMNKQ